MGSSVLSLPFPAVAGETSWLVLLQFFITVPHAAATFSGEVLQLWALFGSLKPMKNVRLTVGATVASIPSRHQFIGTKRSSIRPSSAALAQSPTLFRGSPQLQDRLRAISALPEVPRGALLHARRIRSLVARKPASEVASAPSSCCRSATDPAEGNVAGASCSRREPETCGVQGAMMARRRRGLHRTVQDHSVVLERVLG